MLHLLFTFFATSLALTAAAMEIHNVPASYFDLSCPPGSQPTVNQSAYAALPAPSYILTQGDPLISLPTGLTISRDEQWLFVTDRVKAKVLKVQLSSGAVSYIGAGSLLNPDDVVQSPDGNTLYIADTGNHRIQKVELRTNGDAETVSTLVGNGTSGFVDGDPSRAMLFYPKGLALSADGKWLLVADEGNARIRQVETSTGTITSLVGSGVSGSSDGQGTNLTIAPVNLALHPSLDLLFVSQWNYCNVRQVDLTSGVVTTLAGQHESCGDQDGTSDVAQLDSTYGLSVSADGQWLFVNAGSRIRRVEISSGTVETLVDVIGFGSTISPQGDWLFVVNNAAGGTITSIRILDDEECLSCPDPLPQHANYSVECAWQCLEGYVENSRWSGMCQKTKSSIDLLFRAPYTQAGGSILARLVQEMKPSVAASMDEFLVTNNFVYRDESLSCFNSSQDLGFELCYDPDFKGQCNVFQK